ncbi:MAG: TetR/AcrR family transcriptional regulator [Acidimicrobiia bacterium]
MSTSSDFSTAAVEPLTPERRRQQTRDHLLEAAGRVFAERGFHGATMDQVAAAAGFTKGAVYSNFKNKEDLFLALLDERIQQQLALVEQAHNADSGEWGPAASQPWVDITAQMLWGDRDWQLLNFEFVLYAARHEEARRKLAERERATHKLLQPLIEVEFANLINAGFSAEDVMTIVTALFGGISNLHLTDPDTSDEHLVETAINFLNRAIVGPTSE